MPHDVLVGDLDDLPAEGEVDSAGLVSHGAVDDVVLGGAVKRGGGEVGADGMVNIRGEDAERAAAVENNGQAVAEHLVVPDGDGVKADPVAAGGGKSGAYIHWRMGEATMGHILLTDSCCPVPERQG